MELLFLLSLFLIAYLYSSIGHGGASGYIAVMALFATAPDYIKPAALILNIVVSSIALFNYYRAGHYKWKLTWPFIVLSIPCAFIGSGLEVSHTIFNIILLVFLLIAAVRLLLEKKFETHQISNGNLMVFIGIGGIIGFFSGIIGIGGGIILSPILVLFRWATIKEAAAVSALFILVNSISGTLALPASKLFFPNEYLWWIVAVVTGGTLGSYLGSSKISPLVLRYFLAAVLLMACLKLIM